MRGRHNHGKRQAAYFQRQLRYGKRRYRANQSGRKQHSRHGFVPPVGGHRPKWDMVHWPGKQHPLRFYVKRAAAWAAFAHTGYLVIMFGGKGRRVPPRWKAFPSLRSAAGPHSANQRNKITGKVRRRSLALGHKTPRLNGVRRQAAWARMYYFAHGMLGYPSWDPDHRQPVFP